MSIEKMQHCFWCGEETGIHKRYRGDDPECCGKKECNREQRDMLAQQEEDERYRYKRGSGGFMTY